MMKRLLLFLSVILISIASYGQKQICLEDTIVAKMIDELIVKDHLQFTVNELDSTLTIYKNTVDSLRGEVVVLKLDAKDYNTAVTALREDVILKNSEIRDLRKANFKAKIVSFLKGLITGLAIAVTYVILTGAH
jgi:hypothetical protein